MKFVAADRREWKKQEGGGGSDLQVKERRGWYLKLPGISERVSTGEQGGAWEN